jgi:hypothetical protein
MANGWQREIDRASGLHRTAAAVSGIDLLRAEHSESGNVLQRSRDPVT